MRLVSRSAEAEWNALPQESLLRRAVLAYLEGRKAYLANPTGQLPIEFRALGLERKDIPEWTPADVLAIGRFQSWEFSYDLRAALQRLQMKIELGDKMGTLLNPEEFKDSKPLYSQSLVKGVGTRADWFGSFAKLESPLVPTEAADAGTKDDQTKDKHSSLIPSDRERFYALDPVLGADQGASNLWTIQDSKVGRLPTLCNDTHLSMSWPAPLYPLEYSLVSETEGHVEGQGFSIPGVPGLVIARIHREGIEHLVWGITLANYAKAQDLIKVSAVTLKSAKVTQEKFLVHDMKSALNKTEVFAQSWTKWGPRIDEFMPGLKEPTALDWIGFRTRTSPVEFFLRRNLVGSENMGPELGKHFRFPAVNFTWIRQAISKQAGSTEPAIFGHVVTGDLFERVSGSQEIINESQSSARKIVSMSERPFVLWTSVPDQPFFLVTGNQRIWPGEMAHKLAYDWNDGARSERIVQEFSKNALEPESSQNDPTSPSMLLFVKQARALVDVNRLCGEGQPEEQRICQRVLSDLDAWDGKALADRHETTIAAGWYARFKEQLWPGIDIHKSDALKELFHSWHRSNGSVLAVKSLLANREGARDLWEKTTSHKMADALMGAFRSAMNDFRENLGWLPEDWTWGSVHHVAWRHPFALLPPPMGPFLTDGLLGVGPSMSGVLDSPMRTDFAWSPEHPSEFPIQHGSVMRMCTTLDPEFKHSKSPWEFTRWTSATGVSGNPFSKWAWAFSRDYYFQNKLFSEPGQ